jgi:hypothetical protein
VAKNIILAIAMVLLILVIIFFIISRIELAGKEREIAQLALDVNDRAVRLTGKSDENIERIGELESDRGKREEIVRELERVRREFEDYKRIRQEAYSRIRIERDKLAERIRRAEEISREEFEIIKSLLSP